MVEKQQRISFENAILRIPKEIIEKYRTDGRTKKIDLKIRWNDPEDNAFYMAAEIIDPKLRKD